MINIYLIFLEKFTIDKNKKIQHRELLEKENLTKLNWKIIVDEKNSSSANQFFDSLSRCSARMGVIVERPIIEKITSRSVEGVINEMRNMRLNNELKIIVVLLSNFSQSHYNQIKTYLNTEVGTPSQVVKIENLSKNLSYFSNILMQIMVKMGGRLFKINFMKNLYNEKYVNYFLIIKNNNLLNLI